MSEGFMPAGNAGLCSPTQKKYFTMVIHECQHKHRNLQFR